MRNLSICEELNILLKQGKYLSVLDRFEEYSSGLGDDIDPDCLLQEIIALYYLEYYEEVISECRKFKVDAFNSDVYYFRGLSYFKLQDYSKSEADLLSAIELQQSFTLARLGLVEIYMKSNFGEERMKATKQLELATKFDEENPDIYVAWGFLSLCNNSDEEAFQYFEKALEISPSNYEARLGLGGYYEKKAKFEMALKEYIWAERKELSNPTAFLKAAKVLFSMEKEEEGLEHFKKYILNRKKLEFSEEETIENSNRIEMDAFGGNPDEGRICMEIAEAVQCIKNYSLILNDDSIVHYTNLKVVDSIISNGDGFFRFYNVSYMNDPSEGNVLFEWLREDSNLPSLDNKLNESNTDGIYIGSFVPYSVDEELSHHNDLVLWRTYGKDETGNDGAGCNIIIRKGYFKDDYKIPSSEGGIRRRVVRKLPLYRVIYYDRYKREFLVETEIESKFLLSQLKEIRAKLIELFKIAEEPGRNRVNSFFNSSIAEIKHLFKYSYYSFESECRIIIGISSDHPNVSIDGERWPKKLFYSMNRDIRPFLKKVTLGPKVTNPKDWIFLAAEMKKNGFNDFLIEESGLPFK